MIQKNNILNTYKPQNGVTLVEILIALSIISVLSAIAYPSYTANILKSHRAEAIEAITKTQLHIESLYSERTEPTSKAKYEALLELVINKNSGACLLEHVCNIDNDRYHLSYRLTDSGMDIYTLIATPQANLGQNNDTCGTLSLNAAGVGSGAETNCW